MGGTALREGSKSKKVESPSTGIGWAYVMLALIGIECIALIEIIWFDRSRNELSSGSSIVNLYFGVVLTSFLAQLSGILLVTRGMYRQGGVLQMVGSAVHLVKIEGLIGIVGGVRAYRYPDKGLESSETAVDQQE